MPAVDFNGIHRALIFGLKLAKSVAMGFAIFIVDSLVSTFLY